MRLYLRGTHSLLLINTFSGFRLSHKISKGQALFNTAVGCKGVDLKGEVLLMKAVDLDMQILLLSLHHINGAISMHMANAAATVMHAK